MLYDCIWCTLKGLGSINCCTIAFSGAFATLQSITVDQLCAGSILYREVVWGPYFYPSRNLSLWFLQSKQPSERLMVTDGIPNK